jgi:hypothetical protein
MLHAKRLRNWGREHAVAVILESGAGFEDVMPSHPDVDAIVDWREKGNAPWKEWEARQQAVTLRAPSAGEGGGGDAGSEGASVPVVGGTPDGNAE